jgi:hypothetical protein
MFSCSEDGGVGLIHHLDPRPPDGNGIIETCIVDRQCSTDAYHEFINGDTDNDHINGMINYFRSLELPIYKAEFIRHYYEAVCEACYICPSGSIYPVEMRQSDIPVLLSKGIWFTECDKTIEYIQMTYAETKCADRWEHPTLGTVGIIEQKKLDLATFLVDRDIIPGFIDVLESNAEDCEACSCLSGFTYQVLCNKSDVGVMTEIGFKTL